MQSKLGAAGETIVGPSSGADRIEAVQMPLGETVMEFGRLLEIEY
jgi:hypothetical protein